jgi:hypothetical protein
MIRGMSGCNWCELEQQRRRSTFAAYYAIDHTHISIYMQRAAVLHHHHHHHHHHHGEEGGAEEDHEVHSTSTRIRQIMKRLL